VIRGLRGAYPGLATYCYAVVDRSAIKGYLERRWDLTARR
jgi:hypothetical protein